MTKDTDIIKKKSTKVKKIEENLPKTSTIKKVSVTSKKVPVKKTVVTSKSRVNKNKDLYENGKSPINKQQKPNLDSKKTEDAKDIERIIKTKKVSTVKRKILNLENQKNKYKKGFLIFLVLSIVLVISLVISIFIHIKYEPKTIIKEVEKEIIDENILFLGDSITHRYDLDKYYSDHNTVNSGVEGNMANNILDDMKNRIYQYNPSKIFLLIGVNDISEMSVDDVFKNIEQVVEQVSEHNKHCKVYIESLFPINKTVRNCPAWNKNKEDIVELNEKIEKLCSKSKCTFINLYDELKDEEENLKKEYTIDGLHLSDEGYDVITNKLKEYISN